MAFTFRNEFLCLTVVGDDVNRVQRFVVFIVGALQLPLLKPM
jgi:hypothetical protein